jgi:uncharacterized protein
VENRDAVSASIRNRVINWLDFVVRELPRAKAFYTSAFGWTFTDYGPE